MGQYSSQREAQDAKFNIAFNTAPSPDDSDDESQLERHREILLNLTHLKKNLPMTVTSQLSPAPKPFILFNNELAHFRGLVLKSQNQQIIPDPEHLIVSNADRKKALNQLIDERQLQIDEFRQIKERHLQSQAQKVKPVAIQTRKKVTLRRSTRTTLASTRPQRQQQPRPQQQQRQQEENPIPPVLPRHHPPTAYPISHPHQRSAPPQPTATTTTVHRQSDANRPTTYNKYGILAALRKFHAIKEVQRQKEKKFSTAETIRFFGINRPVSFYHS